MITIRKNQMIAFEKAAEDNFVREVMAFQRENLPNLTDHLTLTEQDLKEEVQAGIAKARSYGIEGKSDIVFFISLRLIAGPEFDSHPMAQEILTDPTIPSDERMEILADNLTDEIVTDMVIKSVPSD
jgi:hypothetical protein